MPPACYYRKNNTPAPDICASPFVCLKPGCARRLALKQCGLGKSHAGQYYIACFINAHAERTRPAAAYVRYLLQATRARRALPLPPRALPKVRHPPHVCCPCRLVQTHCTPHAARCTPHAARRSLHAARRLLHAHALPKTHLPFPAAYRTLPVARHMSSTSATSSASARRARAALPGDSRRDESAHKPTDVHHRAPFVRRRWPGAQARTSWSGSRVCWRPSICAYTIFESTESGTLLVGPALAQQAL
ncbi:hypothetical protein GGX14DRAFT_668407 [Mycena pura]|uniref:Uncharacterized protein n=1 Tax=Mycena pura TaxID=153505 RepID=A0AAD6Y3C1_9AGAR|nr:hypothetical protein GGX14DRAFT_668407 [Mycena pura]